MYASACICFYQMHTTLIWYGLCETASVNMLEVYVKVTVFSVVSVDYIEIVDSAEAEEVPPTLLLKRLTVIV